MCAVFFPWMSASLTVYIISRKKNAEGKDDWTSKAEIIKLGQKIASQASQPSWLVKIGFQIIP